MVNPDGAEVPETIDHIGIALWQAAWDWRRRMADEMAARGYPWHREARGEVLAHLGPSGRAQAELTAAMGMTKQAVQQLLDQLEEDGVIKRVLDPSDKRARRIELTELVLRDYAARTMVKRAIEERYRIRLGHDLFAQLEEALRRLRDA